MGYEKIVTLAERCAKYTQACGKRSILETKPAGKVDVSKLGICLSDGSVHFQNYVIRYKTAEEAKNAMKEMFTQRYKVPEAEQKEISISLLGRDLYMGKEGPIRKQCTGHEALRSSESMPDRVFDSYHNHLHHSEISGSNPLSVKDIRNLILLRRKSITAFNQDGEYCTARIIDTNRLMHGKKDTESVATNIKRILQHLRILGYMERDGKRLIQLRRLKRKRTLPPELYNELFLLEYKFSTFSIKRYHTQKPNKYCQILNDIYKRILPNFGIEYKTNFSNLLKYDA